MMQLNRKGGQMKSGVRFVLPAIALLFVSVLLAGQQKAVTEDGQTVILMSNGTWFYEGKEPTETIQILAHGAVKAEHFETIYGPGRQVFGKVRNNTNEVRNFVIVTVDYFNEAGEMIDTQDVLVGTLQPGEVKSFKTQLVKEFSSYEVSAPQ